MQQKPLDDGWTLSSHTFSDSGLLMFIKKGDFFYKYILFDKEKEEIYDQFEIDLPHP